MEATSRPPLPFSWRTFQNLSNVQREIIVFNYYYFFYDVTLAPQGPTVNSGGYPCDNVELLDVEPLSDLGGGDNGNDCWNIHKQQESSTNSGFFQSTIVIIKG